MVVNVMIDVLWISVQIFVVVLRLLPVWYCRFYVTRDGIRVLLMPFPTFALEHPVTPRTHCPTFPHVAIYLRWWCYGSFTLFDVAHHCTRAYATLPLPHARRWTEWLRTLPTRALFGMGVLGVRSDEWSVVVD